MSIFTFAKTLVVLMILVFVFQSCSTGYQASRYSHLKYVKSEGNKVKSGNNTISQAEIKELPAPNYKLAVPGADDYASLTPQIAKPAKKFQPVQSEMDSRATEAAANLFSKPLSGTRIGQYSITLGNELIVAGKLPSNDLIYDQDKLLLLWLILAGAAIVFGLLTPIAWPFGVLATIAAIAAIVFFVLWIVNIARS